MKGIVLSEEFVLSESIAWDGAAIFLLACTVAMVLAVPVFPTQDGPVHLYYVDVLRDLLRHSGPLAQHFEIKTFFTPYALEYYSLLVLEMIFSPTASEKLLICGYIFAFGLGFRYLVRSVSERSEPWTLAGIPFCMNLMVYMGFLNYCIAAALALFSCGFWIRYWREHRPRQIAGLLVCFSLILFTHPVPAAVFLLFAGMHFAVDFIRASSATSWTSWAEALRKRRQMLAILVILAGAAAIWVSMFVNHSQAVAQPVRLGLIQRITAPPKLWGMSPFSSRGYRVALGIPLYLVGLAWLAAISRRATRFNSLAIALAVTSGTCLALFCLAPESINGSQMFPERFAIFWVTLLIAATAALGPARQWSRIVGVTSFCAGSVLLLLQWANVSRIALEMKPVMVAPAAKAGQMGLIIGGSTPPEGLSFDPFIWSGAHYFRRSEAILANTPWMDLAIIMLRPVQPDRWSYLDPSLAERSLASFMREGRTLADLSFVLVEGPSDGSTEAVVNDPRWNPITPKNGALRIFARSR